MEKKKNQGFLRWPWNVVIYILLVVVFRIFSIPIILILVWYQQKNNPHGVAEGYCLSRTRKRLSWLLWSLLLVFLSVCLAVYFLDGIKTERGHWETNDYVTLIISAGGTVVLAAAGLYMGYAALRDTFFPARSALAQSIRSQLPYPDEAPEAAELFGMVDRDLKENGRWFGPVGIGKEWVLGDAANRIDRIRGIFVVDQTRVRSGGGRTQSSRTLELVLIDNRWQKSVTAFRDPGDLRAAADCLALRVPDARRGKNDQYVDFLRMDESEQEEFERDFRQKQNRRASARALQESMNGPQDMILKLPNGEVTSRVSVSLAEDTLKRCLAGEETGFELIPTRPIEGEGRAFRSLSCRVWREAESPPEVELMLTGEEEGSALVLTTDDRRAEDILRRWLRREAPELKGWRPRRVYTAPEPARPKTRGAQAKLSLLYAGGAAENHTTFTEEDIRLAAEGIVDGTYQLVDLTHSNGYLWIRVTAGDKNDARCTVEATRPGGPELEFYITKMPPRRAAEWLTGYPGGEYLPGGPDWKNITRQMKKRK